MRFDPSAERLRLPGYGAYRSDEEDDLPDPFDAAIDRGVSGALGADMEFTPEEADAFNPNPDMTFSVDEVPGYTPDLNAAYQTATTAARNELAGPAAVPGYAAPVQATQDAPVPAVAGQPPTAPPVPPPSPAVAPTGTGAAIPGYQNPLDTLSQPQAAPQGPQPQAPSPVQPAPGPERQAKARAGITTGSRADRQRMAEAEHRDRVLRGVSGGLRGLGMLLAGIGAGRGNMALAGLGAGIGGVGGVVPAGGNAERERQRQADQTAREAAAVQAQQRDQQLGTDAERVAVGRLGAEADQVRAQSQAALQARQAERMAAEDALRAGNAAATREFIRGRVRAAPPGPRRDAMAAATSGEAFDQLEDQETLRDMIDAVEGIDPRGERQARAQGQARGGGRWVEDANGHAQWRPGRGGGRQAAPAWGDPYASANQAPTTPAAAPQGQQQATTPGDIVDPFAPHPAPVAAPAQAPARGRPAARNGRQRPAAAPTSAPAVAGGTQAATAPPVAGQEIDMTPQGVINDVESLLRLQGLTPQDQSWSLRRNNLLRDLTSSDDATARQARTDLRAQISQAASAQAGDMPVGLPPSLSGEWARFRNEATPYDRGAQAALSMASRMRRIYNRDRAAFARAVAFTGRESVPLDDAAQRIRAEIGAYMSDRLHDLSGAAVSVPEFARIANSMGTGSLVWGGLPDEFINILERGAERSAREYANRRAGFDSRIASAYESRRFGTQGGSR